MYFYINVLPLGLVSVSHTKVHHTKWCFKVGQDHKRRGQFKVACFQDTKARDTSVASEKRALLASARNKCSSESLRDKLTTTHIVQAVLIIIIIINNNNNIYNKGTDPITKKKQFKARNYIQTTKKNNNVLTQNFTFRQSHA